MENFSGSIDKPVKQQKITRCSIYLQKIIARDQSLSHDNLFHERREEQSLYDLEKYTFKNTYIDKLEKNTIS